MNNKEGSPIKSWNSKSQLIEEQMKSCSGGGFDCNICLDSVNDPVVTFCGHLYCWPCIYKWIHNSDNHATDQQESQCPVCKAEVSEKTLIPLFGLSTNPSDEKKAVIPQRPRTPECTFSPPSINRQLPRRNDRHHHPHLSELDIGGARMTNGEMVYSQIFGNLESTLYTYPNSDDLASNYANPRLRRYMMKVDRSLGRICFFLFCCTSMCLLLF